jgi:hypothetical protein
LLFSRYVRSSNFCVFFFSCFLIFSHNKLLFVINRLGLLLDQKPPCQRSAELEQRLSLAGSWLVGLELQPLEP